MRKQTKLVAVLSTAALLAIGASMTSFAATGWQEEDGTWVYYDRDEERVTEEWRRSGDNWFWLDDNGEMAVDQLIEDDDDYYYVNEAGAMVSNQWVAIENEDAGEDDEPDVYWYYFQANGKAYKRSDSATTSLSAKTINGKKYAFDTEGKMLYGWVDADDPSERLTGDDAWIEGDYYFGDENDGAMSLGWRQLSIVDDNYEGIQPGDEFWDEEQDRWFYFQTSGKKVKADDDDTLKTKTINGRKYGFDEYGRMIGNWFSEATVTDGDGTGYVDVDGKPVAATQGNARYSSTFMYFSNPEDGALVSKGWFKVIPGYYLDESKYNDGAEYWYYADGDGDLYANVIKTIKGKKYAFDGYGRMISGLALLRMESSSVIEEKIADDETGYEYDTEENFDKTVSEHSDELTSGDIRFYYFGGSDDGAMKTGKQTVEIDGENFTFKFKDSSSSKGAAIHGKDDDKLYNGGKLIKASSDDKYKVVKVEKDTDGTITMSTMDAETFTDDVCVKREDKEDETIWTAPEYKKDDQIVYYLVNTSGSIVKTKSSAKDGEDYKFKVKDQIIESVTLEN